MRRILVGGVCATVVFGGSGLALPMAVALVSSPSHSEPMKGDFNGDGFADLAIGVPFDGRSGGVNVIYGSASGLTETGDQLWSQDSPGIKEVADGEQFGSSLAVADFDGDGFADLVVGAPAEDITIPAGREGGVNVIYGSPSGLTAAGNQFWSQDSPGIEDLAERDDRFGSSLAAADFDGDGFADLAVGVPYENAVRPGDFGEGGVNVIYGSPSGLTAAGNQFWSQDSPGIEEIAEDTDLFGFALAAADFGKGTRADLAVGVPRESVGAVGLAGGVNVIYGAAGGLSEAGDQFWSQDSPGIKEVAEGADTFGFSLAAADFGKSPRADLAVGAKGEDFAGVVEGGGVNVIYGSGGGLKQAGDQFWSQNSPGITDVAEPFDQFGFSLAAADFGKSTRADLAVGVPFENNVGFGGLGKGAVNVIYGSGGGLKQAGDQFWSQDSPGIQEVAEPGDQLGFSLAAADFGNGTRADLAVGVPEETVGTILPVGGVNVIYGSADGLSEAGDQFWSQDSPGIKGEAEVIDQFGFALGAFGH
jgi:disulfide bond formation protein DsbB